MNQQVRESDRGMDIFHPMLKALYLIDRSGGITYWSGTGGFPLTLWRPVMSVVGNTLSNIKSCERLVGLFMFGVMRW